jgi:hypothetical protein
VTACQAVQDDAPKQRLLQDGRHRDRDHHGRQAVGRIRHLQEVAQHPLEFLRNRDQALDHHVDFAEDGHRADQDQQQRRDVPSVESAQAQGLAPRPIRPQCGPDHDGRQGELGRHRHLSDVRPIRKDDQRDLHEQASQHDDRPQQGERLQETRVRPASVLGHIVFGRPLIHGRQCSP